MPPATSRLRDVRPYVQLWCSVRQPSFRAIMVSYEVTPAGSPLRGLMARTLLQLVGTGDDKSAYSTKLAADEIMGKTLGKQVR